MSGATNEAVACTVSFSFLKMPNSRVKGAEINPGGSQQRDVYEVESASFVPSLPK